MCSLSFTKELVQILVVCKEIAITSETIFRYKGPHFVPATISSHAESAVHLLATSIVVVMCILGKN